MPQKDDISFEEFNTRFKIAAVKRGAKIQIISNGSCVAVFNSNKKPKLALMSGVHGDERAGPLALLSFVEHGKIYSDRALWIAPMVNNLGWDRNKRKWGRYDLNRNFDPNLAPEFLLEIMRSLEKFNPNVFLDLHEDSLRGNSYLFRNLEDPSTFVLDLQKSLDTVHDAWKYPRDWKGSSESYARALGCNLTSTVETPTTWELQPRVAFHLAAVKWANRKIIKYEF